MTVLPPAHTVRAERVFLVYRDYGAKLWYTGIAAPTREHAEQQARVSGEYENHLARGYNVKILTKYRSGVEA